MSSRSQFPAIAETILARFETLTQLSRLEIASNELTRPWNVEGHGPRPVDPRCRTIARARGKT